MKRVYAIFSALLKSWLRSKTGIFFSFLFPVMLLIIFSTVFGGGGSSQYVLFVQNFDVQDDAPTNLSTAFIGALEATDTFDIRHLDTTVDIKTYVRENPSFSFRYRVLQIPHGFEEKSLSKSMSVRIDVVMDTLTIMEQQYAAYMEEADLQQVEKGKALLTRLEGTLPTEPPVILLVTDEQDMAAPALTGIIYGVANSFSNNLIGTEDIVTITGEPLEQRTLKVADYFLPGFIAAFIMTNGIIGATSTISEYRRDGQVKRMAATPLPKISWILGNILQQTVLAFILTGVMIILGWVIFGVRLIPNVYALLLILTGAVAFCSVGMVLGGVIKDVEAANGAGNAIAFPMMFLSGAFWPIEQMPDYLQIVAKFLPLHYFHDGLLQIMVYKNPGQSLTGFVVLGTFAVVFILVALKVTKWKEL
ncbi:MAG: ABC transporter permease [Theionarchaea archaeon]|nr:ABC transporter permease [Theionarchaea archaeon]